MVQPEPRYLTSLEVAELLRTSPGTLRTWRSRNVGPPSIKMGEPGSKSRVLYDRTKLDEWIAEQSERT